jgi:hypothetical protein
VFPGGFGTAIAQSTVFVALAVTVSEKDMAIASSGLFLSGGIGGAAGLSAASAVFQAVLRSALERLLGGGNMPNGDEVCYVGLCVTFIGGP